MSMQLTKLEATRTLFEETLSKPHVLAEELLKHYGSPGKVSELLGIGTSHLWRIRHGQRRVNSALFCKLIACYLDMRVCQATIDDLRA